MRTEPPKTLQLLVPAVPRRRPIAPAPTSLRTRRELRAPQPPALIGSVEVAGVGDERCTHRSGALRCVRAPHPRQSGAHVMVAGSPDVPRLAPGAVPAPAPLRSA